MTIEEKQNELVKEFENAVNWEERYKIIIKMGKELQPLPLELKTEENKIHGCQSQVWIIAQLKDNLLYFQADSDAMIVKGLIAVLIKIFSGHSPEEIYSSSTAFLQKIGIDKHLSPTRSNGLAAMIKQIKMYAFAYKAILEKGKSNF